MARNQSIRLASSSGTIIATAAALAALAYYVRNRALRAERQHPPIGRFITVDGVRLHYVDTGGAGTPVVFLHGNGASILDWKISGLIDKAAQKYRVIAFDRPGFGFSDRPRWHLWTPAVQADLIRKAVEQLGVEKPILVGHSWGSMVTAAMAIRHADFVRGIVLTSGYYFPSLRLDALLLTPPAIPILGDILRYTLSPLMGWVMAPLLLAKMFGPKEVTPKFRREFPISMTLRPWQIRASAAETAFMIPAAGEMEMSYAKIKVPVAIISGGKDMIVDPESQSVRLHKLIRGSKLHVLPGLGHMVHHFAGDTVMNAIDALAPITSKWRVAAAK